MAGVKIIDHDTKKTETNELIFDLTVRIEKVKLVFTPESLPLVFLYIFV